MPQYRHKVLSVTTVATSLLSLVGTNLPGSIIKVLTIQPTLDSAAVIYGGGKDSTLTTADYGWTLPIPDSGVPIGPLTFESSTGIISLADVQVMGTTTTGKISISVLYP